MAYADQQEMSKGRIIAIALVLLLHAGIGYALVTGLAYEAINKVKERLEVIDVQEEEPPEEEPPPPPPEEEVVEVTPPVVAFTPPVKADNTIDNTSPDPPPPPPVDKEPTPLKCGPNQKLQGKTCVSDDPIEPCPNNPSQKVKRSKLSTCRAPEVDKSRKASPKNNRSRWVTTNDYPSRDISRENEGTTRIRLTVGPNGKATACAVTGSSGHASLDKAACSKARSRSRFNAAWDKKGNPTTGSYSTKITWRLPK